MSLPDSSKRLNHSRLVIPGDTRDLRERVLPVISSGQRSAFLAGA